MTPEKKYVLKCHIPGCLHKTDIGGVELFVSEQNIDEKLPVFVNRLPKTLEGIIVVEMANFYNKTPSNGELLLSALIDKAFGPVVCFGLGGTTVEQMQKFMPDSILFIPSAVDVFTSEPWKQKIEMSPAAQFLTGKIRGIPKECEFDEILNAIAGLEKIMNQFLLNDIQIAEIEINPVVVSKKGELLALDGVVKVEQRANTAELTYSGQIEALKPLYKAGLFFSPRTVLLAGVSAKVSTNPCTVVLNKFIELKKNPQHKDLEIFLIHPKSEEIMGIKCYKTLDDVKKDCKQIDLFVCGIAAKAAYPMLMEIIDTGYCHTSFILSAGFGETEAGKQYEKDLREKLAQKEKEFPNNKMYPLFNGANTLGYLWENRVNTVFIDSKKSSSYDNHNELIQSPHKNSAMICESGAFMISRLSDLSRRVAPIMSMSVGNQIDMSATDFLEWLLDENSASQYEREFNEKCQTLRDMDEEKKKLKVFAMYVEGLNENDGIRLIRMIQKCRDQGKLVYIYKSGRTTQGAHAAAGHTASLSGSYSMFKQLVETSGAVCTDSLDEFENSYYLATCAIDKMAAIQNKLKLGVISNAGFECCQYADHLFMPENSENYLELPTFSESDKKDLIQLFNEYKLTGVVDIGEILDTTPTIPDDAYYKFAKVLLRTCGAVVISPVPETHMINTFSGEPAKLINRDFMDTEECLPKYCVKLSEEEDKLIVVTVESGWKYNEFRQYCMEKGLCVFPKSDEASAAINNLARAWLGWWKK